MRRGRHEFARTERLRVQVDGQEVGALAGQSVAAALLAADVRALSLSRDGAPRGLFCGMGVCHDCLVTIDGRAGQRACMVSVRDGMTIGLRRAQPDLLGAELADLAQLPPAPMPEEQCDVVVVGGGPAGLSAAAEARRSGAAVLLVDERSALGGQYFKQPATRAAVPPSGPDRQSRDGAALVAEVERGGTRASAATTVWGAFRDQQGRLQLGLLRAGEAWMVSARMLVIATGAFERPSMIPGWTLPGVMTTGAAQTLLRAYGVVAGRRILLAGNGPLNLQVAAELVRAGAKVVGVVDRAASPLTRPARALAMAAAGPSLAATGLAAMASLKRAAVPILWGHRLIAVAGQDRAERATIRDLDGKAADLLLEVDAVCLGDGFAPANELARLLGCRHRVVARGTATVLETETGRLGETSLADVFVAGEAGRFGGAHVAALQGALAGREAARRLGHAAGPDRTRALDARLHAQQRFQRALWALFEAPEPDPLSEIGDETIVCRCEGVSAGRVRAAITTSQVDDLASLKRLTRAGMGRCQGRYCAGVLRGLFGEGPSVEGGMLAPQVPLRPVPLAALAVEKPEWGGHRRSVLPDAATSSQETLPRREAATVVIGAGIVGVSTALFLSRAGHDVVLIDGGQPNAAASGGNAGSLHAQLLSFDHGPKAAGRAERTAATLALQKASIDLWRRLEQEIGADFEIKVTGGLMVAETAAQLDFLAAKAAVERRSGIDTQIVDAAELRRMEPALADDLCGAAFCADEGKINPLIATTALLSAARALGLPVFSNAVVQAIEPDGAGFRLVTSRGELRCGRVVNAAGAWSAGIARLAGVDIPVHGAPLQMIVTEAAAPCVGRLVAHADRHLTLKQARNGNVIIGGGWTAALDPVHGSPRPIRASLEGNLWVAQRVVPALRKLHVLRSWAAMNIDIDGAPILGEDPRRPGLFHAVGANGYTLGPILGLTTAELILRGKAERDIAPFSLTRFDQPGGLP